MADEDHDWIRKVKDGELKILSELITAQRRQIGGCSGG